MSQQDERTVARFAPGTRIDEKYEIVEHLGEGGFASVFLAKQLPIDRLVAIKILHTRGGGDANAASFEERFLLEAKIAARISHPNVVTIHDFGFTPDTREPYIVMEYLQGHDIEAEIENIGPMEPARIVPLFATVLEALGEGHRQGVVHKDLKPANLFLTDPGSSRENLKILDFGVARMIETEGGKLTSTGQMFGTPQYMSPEYIERSIVTPALDVYQMALILVEAITGQCVVDGDTAYLCCVVHCRGELEIPAALLESPLGPVLTRALALDYTERYADASAFAAALRDIDATAIHFTPGDTRSQKLSNISGSLRAVASSQSPNDTGALTKNTGGQIAFKPTMASSSMRASDVMNVMPEPVKPSQPVSKPKKGLGIGVLVAIVLLLLLLIGGAGAAVVGILMYGGDEVEDKAAVAAVDNEQPAEEPEAAEVPAAEESPEVVEEVAEEVDEPEDPRDDAPAAAEPEGDKKSARIEVVSNPGGAAIYQGKRRLGTTPTTVARPDETLVLQLRKRGFETLKIEIGPDSDATVTAGLEARGRKKVPAAVAAKKSPTPSKGTEPAEPKGSGKMAPKSPAFDFADGSKPSKTKPKKKKKGLDFVE